MVRSSHLFLLKLPTLIPMIIPSMFYFLHLLGLLRLAGSQNAATAPKDYEVDLRKRYQLSLCIDCAELMSGAYEFPSGEYEALYDLYYSTNGNNWKWRPVEDAGPKWDFSDPAVNPCAEHWQGLNCTTSPALNTSSVIGIHLVDYNMAGQLPSSINNLSQLRYLVAHDNHLNGTLPNSLGSLQNLNILDLHGNDINGSIPNALGNLQSLEYLLLGRNLLHGHLPPTLGNLKSILGIEIANNSISGPLPEALSQASTIRDIVFVFNRLSGTLPNSYSKLTNLVTFNVFNNTLEGSIPESYCGLLKLKLLTLASNKLEGAIPTCISQLSALNYLNLYNNKLTGTIPASFAGMPALAVLNFNDNLLHGSIDVLCEIPTLTQFYLQDNYLSGTIPVCLANLPVLNDLYLASNEYTGTIPEALGRLKNMKYIDLSMNRLSGTIPASFANMTHLSFLHLFQNRLEGSIPKSFSQLAELTLLLLQDNRLTGNIDNVFNATVQKRLSTIQLSNNQLTGVIPEAPFHSKFILIFSAVDNCLHGSIPTIICDSRSLSVLALDGMSTAKSCRQEILNGISDSYIITKPITGGIPTCLFQMHNLTTLHLSGNGIKGSLPLDISLGHVLLDLALSHNEITGSIPPAIQERVWYSLDLSYNRFSGSLKPTFNTLPVVLNRIFHNGIIDISLSYNSENTYLSLQNNRLSGNIPHSVHDLADLTILNGNLFKCDWDQSDLPPNDSGKNSYQCGSNLFNAQIFVWLTLSGVVAIVVLVVWRWQEGIERFVSVQSSIEVLKLWYNALERPELQGKLRNFKYVCEVGNVIFRISAWCTLLIVVVGVPGYVALSRKYGTVTHEYAWAVSALFTSGVVPFALEFAAYVALLVFVLVTMSRYKRQYLKFESDDDEVRTTQVGTNYSNFMRPSTLPVTAVAVTSTISMSSATAAHSTTKAASRSSIYAAYVTFFAINFTLVIGVNIVFVYVALYENNSVLVLSQLLLSLFKGFWNSYGAMYLMRWSFHSVSTQNDSSGADFINTQLFAALFNNIAIPCLVTAAVSPDCFYNLFVLAPNVDVYYIYLECFVFVEETCAFYYPTLSSTSYHPPFTYSYQCGAQYVMAYAPTFVYLALEVAFINPLVLAAMQQLHKRASSAPASLWFRFLDYWIYPNLKPFDKTLAADGAVPRDLYNPFFDANQLVVLLMTYFGVILTYGVVFPPLAVVMLVAVASLILTNRLVMGRYIVNALDQQVPQYLDAIELDSKGVGLLHLSRLRAFVWLIVWFCCWFYALYLFEVLGNNVGLNGSIWVFIALPLVPFGLYILRIVSRKRNQVAVLRVLRRSDSNIELRESEASRSPLPSNQPSPYGTNNPMLSEAARRSQASDAVTEQQSITAEDLEAERVEYF